MLHDELAGHGHDPGYAPMNADTETNLRRVTPMLIRQPDDEVSIPSPVFCIAAHLLSHILLHCSVFVTALSQNCKQQHQSNVCSIQVVTVFSLLFCYSAKKQGECVT